MVKQWQILISFWWIFIKVNPFFSCFLLAHLLSGLPRSILNADRYPLKSWHWKQKLLIVDQSRSILLEYFSIMINAGWVLIIIDCHWALIEGTLHYDAMTCHTHLKIPHVLFMASPSNICQSAGADSFPLNQWTVVACIYTRCVHYIKGTRGGPAWCLDTFAFFFYY